MTHSITTCDIAEETLDFFFHFRDNEGNCEDCARNETLSAIGYWTAGLPPFPVDLTKPATGRYRLMIHPFCARPVGKSEPQYDVPPISTGAFNYLTHNGQVQRRQINQMPVDILGHALINGYDDIVGELLPIFRRCDELTTDRRYRYAKAWFTELDH